jgi:hypothetical protein
MSAAVHDWQQVARLTPDRGVALLRLLSPTTTRSSPKSCNALLDFTHRREVIHLIGHSAHTGKSHRRCALGVEFVHSSVHFSVLADTIDTLLVPADTGSACEGLIPGRTVWSCYTLVGSGE